MKTYPHYKDSGFHWIGIIPEHWDITRVKTSFSIKGRIGWKGLRSDEFETQSYAYLVTGQDFRGAEIEWNSCYQINKDRYDEDPFIQIKNGDILVTKDGTIGKIAKVTHLDKPACLNSGIFVMRQLNCNTFNQGYLYWLLVSKELSAFNEITKTGATIAHLYQNVFERMPMTLPPLAEQRAIADYLDEKCGEIDGQVALLEKKRDAYARLKVCVINKAVTHGLNPDVTMRSSGIDWIGDIPAHWERLRLKDVSYMYSGLTGKSGDDFRCDDDTKTKPFVPFTNVLNNTKIDFNQFNRVVMAEGEQQNRVLENDLIFLMSSEDYESIAKSAVVIGDPGEVYLNSFCRGLHFTSNDIYAPFVNYQLNSEKYHDALRFEARGFTRINIKVDRVFSQFITVPPLAEQRAIADYLDKKCGEIDAAVENLDKQIDAYKRLKKSLINEVVTGKRAV